jgi:purine-binding chemotaxis protein CheW
MSAEQVCTFYLQGHFFGVPVREVQEVIRYQEMTRVPLAPAEICGLINLRGQIVMAIDLRRRMGFPERPNDSRATNVVIRTESGAVSLMVDEIGDVIEVTGESFECSPETLRGVAKDLIHGVHKLQDKLLLVLNLEHVLRCGEKDAGELARALRPSELSGETAKSSLVETIAGDSKKIN